MGFQLALAQSRYSHVMIEVYDFRCFFARQVDVEHRMCLFQAGEGAPGKCHRAGTKTLFVPCGHGGSKYVCTYTDGAQ